MSHFALLQELHTRARYLDPGYLESDLHARVSAALIEAPEARPAVTEAAAGDVAGAA